MTSGSELQRSAIKRVSVTDSSAEAYNYQPVNMDKYQTYWKQTENLKTGQHRYGIRISEDSFFVI